MRDISIAILATILAFMFYYTLTEALDTKVDGLVFYISAYIFGLLLAHLSK